MLDTTRALRAVDVRAVCDPDSLGDWATTAELTPFTGFFAQPRVVEGIEMGLSSRDKSYNILLIVPRLAGSVKAVTLEKIKEFTNRPGTRWAEEEARDICCVFNFDDPHRPKCLFLPKGKGSKFHEAMENVRAAFQAKLRTTFTSQWYQREYVTMGSKFSSFLKSKKEALEKEFKEACGEAIPFSGDEAPNWYDTLYVLPILDSTKPGIFTEDLPYEKTTNASIGDSMGKVKSYLVVNPAFIQDWLKRFENLTKEDRDRLAARILEVSKEVTIERKNRNVAETAFAEKATGDVFDTVVTELRIPADYPEAMIYLEGLRQFLVTSRATFLLDDNGVTVMSTTRNNSFSVFEINVLVDNSDLKDAAPVIWDDDPTYTGVLGRVARPETLLLPNSSSITGTHDHRSLHAGSLLRANGGVFIVPGDRLDTFTWDVMTRALEKGEVTIQDPGDRGLTYYRPETGKFNPEPIPLNVRVVLVVEREAAYKIFQLNPTFFHLFKARAEFVTATDRTPENEQNLVSFLSLNSQRAALLPCTRGAAALLIEHASRLASDQRKLSLNVGTIKDLQIQADYWARQEKGAKVITDRHVLEALEHQEYRSNVIQKTMMDLIADGTLLLSLDGSKVGQINGDVVYDLGDIAFGRPSRITATVQIGRDGVINIEREVKLSGGIHDKGVLILSGYLGEHFGQERPMAFTARLAFEQSYQGVEGDSASAAELYVILSSLSDVSIRQDISVTGSINQKGEIQPVGGLNQKIEGMFDACMIYGFTGKQGVIIPHQNVKDLMLRPDVVKAIRKRTFHIWAIKRVEEGIPILTGMEADEFCGLVGKRFLKWSRPPQEPVPQRRVPPVVEAWGPPAL